MHFELLASLPWPRGLAFADDKLYALCRGRPRGAGGPDPEDRAGSLYEVPLDGAPVKLLAQPEDPPFRLWDPTVPKHEDIDTDRPYAGLAWHPRSRNFFICCFSGIDSPHGYGGFRKNATDGVLRFDLDASRWFTVERHTTSHIDSVTPNPRKKPRLEAMRNNFYPNPGSDLPRGWLNGPNGLSVHGDELFVVGKDNHSVVRYDLSVLSNGSADRHEQGLPSDPYRLTPDGRTGDTSVLIDEEYSELFDGPSSLVVSGKTIYIGLRSNNLVLAFVLGSDLRTARKVAQIPSESGLIDLAVAPSGALFASLKNGEVHRVSNPEAAFADPQSLAGLTSQQLYATMPKTQPEKLVAGGEVYQLDDNGSNIIFGPDGTLYACCNKDGGGIYQLSGADTPSNVA